MTSMRAAADREDHVEKNVAMENRLSPMRELLGELLLEMGRPGGGAARIRRFAANSAESFPLAGGRCARGGLVEA